mmetsp:Transcript_62499/g.149122  ORF Transcript_62499/g.149122 Transcript_62499/m.149122 type:complete len:459 (+) Transcript_62499:59-1435(+)
MEYGEGYMVHKKAFSNITRMLCFVGLEGTGHHYFNLVMRSGGKSPSVRAVRPVMPSSWPQSVDMFQFVNTWNQWGMQAQNSKWKARTDKAKPPPTGWNRDDFKTNENYLRQRVQSSKTSSGSKLLVVDPMSTSWPNCLGNHQERSYQCRPDLVQMAEAAENVGVDLRIMLMIRPAEEVLAANCMHRDLERQCDQLSLTFVENAQALRKQFLSLDPAFYANGCSYYGQEHLTETSRGLSHLLEGTPYADFSHIEKQLKGAWVDKHRNSADWDRMKQWAPPLQVAIDLLDQTCRSQGNSSSSSSSVTQEPSFLGSEPPVVASLKAEVPEEGPEDADAEKEAGKVSAEEQIRQQGIQEKNKKKKKQKQKARLPPKAGPIATLEDTLKEGVPFAVLAAANCSCFAICIAIISCRMRGQAAAAALKGGHSPVLEALKVTPPTIGRSHNVMAEPHEEEESKALV